MVDSGWSRTPWRIEPTGTRADQKNKKEVWLNIPIKPAKAGWEVGEMGGSRFVSLVILQGRRENLPGP